MSLVSRIGNCLSLCLGPSLFHQYQDFNLFDAILLVSLLNMFSANYLSPNFSLV